MEYLQLSQRLQRRRKYRHSLHFQVVVWNKYSKDRRPQLLRQGSGHLTFGLQHADLDSLEQCHNHSEGKQSDERNQLALQQLQNEYKVISMQCQAEVEKVKSAALLFSVHRKVSQVFIGRANPL